MLIETGIPPELLGRSRAWFAAQMTRLQSVHGDDWLRVREWLADYLNTDLRIYIKAMT